MVSISGASGDTCGDGVGVAVPAHHCVGVSGAPGDTCGDGVGVTVPVHHCVGVSGALLIPVGMVLVSL